MSLYSLLQRLPHSAGVYSCAHGAGSPGARRPGRRHEAARGGGGGASSPRAVPAPSGASQAPRYHCRPPRSVAECYPVLNVTLTHSIPDTTALTSSIHAARAAIGRASRPGGAGLPLRPFITPGGRQRRRRGAARARGPRSARAAGGALAGRASPTAGLLHAGPGMQPGPDGPQRRGRKCGDVASSPLLGMPRVSTSRERLPAGRLRGPVPGEGCLENGEARGRGVGTSWKASAGRDVSPPTLGPAEDQFFGGSCF